MKKAKVLLTGIAVIAIVGGAVAFKAKSTVSIFYKTTGACTNQLLVDRTVVLPAQFDGSITGATIATEAPASCTATLYYIND